MSGERRFQVIDGGGKPKRYRARKGEASQWTCWQCEADLGIATSAVVRVRHSPMTRGAIIEGGTNIWVCAHCLGRGKLTRCT